MGGAAYEMDRSQQLNAERVDEASNKSNWTENVLSEVGFVFLSPRSSEKEFQDKLEEARKPGYRYMKMSSKEFTDAMKNASPSEALDILHMLTKDPSKNWMYQNPERLNQTLNKLSDHDLVELMDKISSREDRTGNHLKTEQMLFDYWKKNRFDPNVRPATVNEYRAWLKGYIGNGGTIGDVSDYAKVSEFVIVPKKNIELPLNYYSMTFLIPKGISVSSHDDRHEMMYMDGYKLNGKYKPMLYVDVK